MQIKNLEIKLIIYSIAGTLFGMYLGGSFDSWKALILSLIGMTVFCIAAGAYVEELLQPEYRQPPAKPNRALFYVMSAFVVFGTAWIVAALVANENAAGSSCSDNKKVYLNMFYVLLTPTLIGVRIGLGKPKEKE